MIEQAPLPHVRAGRRGRVHRPATGYAMTAVCGLMLVAGDRTADPVDCITCLGQRASRGTVQPAGRKWGPSLVAAAQDLRRTDRALTLLEIATAHAYAAWLERTGAQRTAYGSLPIAPPDAYPKPSEAIRQLVLELQLRFEGRTRVRRLATTVTAHEEILRLQEYLLPRLARRAS